MLRNFILERTINPGAAVSAVLSGAVDGRLGFDAPGAFASGDEVYYVMDDGTLKEWGAGSFTVSAGVRAIQRTTVLGNSLGTTARLNFTGTTDIYCELPAERVAWFDRLGNLPLFARQLYQLAPGTAADHAVNKAQLDAVLARAVPVGTIIDWPGPNLPPRCLYADGSNVSRTTYAELFAAYGTQYGAGDGSTSFGLPDRRGRGGIGRDNMGGSAAGRVTAGVSGLDGTALGAAGGDERMPAHAHTAGASAATSINDPGHVHSLSVQVLSGQNNGSAGPGGFSTIWNQVTADISASFTGITASTTVTVTVNSAGAGIGANVQPSMVTNMIIFAGV